MNEIKGSAPHAVIIGAGVSGLTTAYCLQERGFECTLLASEVLPNTVSSIAGALWEWPPALGGYRDNALSLTRTKRWALTSLYRYLTLPDARCKGVFSRPMNVYFRCPIHEHQPNAEKMRDIQRHVPGFVHDPTLAKQYGVSTSSEIVDAYQHLAPMIDTDVYLHWLLTTVLSRGARLRKTWLTGSLVDEEEKLREVYQAQVIVNCTGLGAQALEEPQLYPIRSAMVRLRCRGKPQRWLQMGHCLAHDHKTREKDSVFVYPRGHRHVVLGTLIEKGPTDTSLRFDDYPPLQAMYERCVAFLPALTKLPIDPVAPVQVGLRAFRPCNVRVERDATCPVVHNYGHGGMGFSLSWGCAEDAAAFACEAIA
ncbi:MULTISPECIES: FAD-dependent oxidoreductase [unclassified Vibrio]|uniref:FAD-dependent oxidoreductase n=1 Tax=unclassified Vibrio TaxID=2614977 RepID=UPI001268E0FD|nr:MULTISPECIES: FAD-dependent oxidoreductase [unclassified Vibrio]QFT40004.1 D-amino acid dehydrogenase small subunit [Vibrio sp. THAF64]QGM37871.1 D-amino acid dehydrogenase small subunit [Vibrio sp. THAF191d]QGN73214.1 D-amino acid dehydrogenase small subunit [Vibrio sp. THAF191c]